MTAKKKTHPGGHMTDGKGGGSFVKDDDDDCKDTKTGGTINAAL